MISNPNLQNGVIDMKKYGVYYILMLFLAATCLEAAQPNIIFIVTDDHGHNDLQATDLRKEVDMPNVHRLSTNGVLMTQAYCTAPQCVPSRAGIVTGRYQQRFGIDANGEGPLPASQKSIASRLKDFGYTTGHVGKWHLEPNRETTKWLAENGYKSMADVPESVVSNHRSQAFGYDEYAQGTGNQYWSNFAVNGKSFPATDVNYLWNDGCKPWTRPITREASTRAFMNSSRIAGAFVRMLKLGKGRCSEISFPKKPVIEKLNKQWMKCLPVSICAELEFGVPRLPRN